MKFNKPLLNKKLKYLAGGFFTPDKIIDRTNTTPGVVKFITLGKFGGGNFRGSGAGGRWDYTFNEAFDNAVRENKKTFWFGGKEFNTKKENNPVREYNNRVVGKEREEKDYKKLVANSDKDYYPEAYGPINTPESWFPDVTDTYKAPKQKPIIVQKKSPSTWDTFVENIKSIFSE